MCKVIMVAETFTIFVTSLLTFRGSCLHVQIHMMR